MVRVESLSDCRVNWGGSQLNSVNVFEHVVPGLNLDVRLSTRVGPQGFRVTRWFVPLGRLMFFRCREPGVQAATEERFEIEDIWRRHLIQLRERKHYAQNRILLRIL